MSMRSGYFFCAVHGCPPSPDPLMSPIHISKLYGAQTQIPLRPTLTSRYTTCARHKAIVKIVAYTLLRHIAHTFPSIFRTVRPHKRPDLLTALGSISRGSYVMTTFGALRTQLCLHACVKNHAMPKHTSMMENVMVAPANESPLYGGSVVDNGTVCSSECPLETKCFVCVRIVRSVLCEKEYHPPINKK